MSMDIDYKGLVDKFVQQNRHVPEIQFIISEPGGVLISEDEGGGLVNYIIRVQSEDGLHSVVLKHGLEQARCSADMRFSMERQAREYNALRLMDRILPSSVPKPYCYDICMEDMESMDILGDDLRKGEINLETASSIGRIVAQMHKATSKKEIPQQEWQQLEALFADRKDVEMLLDNQSGRFFNEDDPLVRLSEGVLPVFREYTTKLQTKHIGKKLREKLSLRECFIHSDCHWMSVFTKEGRIALFDFEFGHLGNPDYQLAWIAIAYYICMLEASSKYPSRAQEIREKSELAFRTIINSYYKVRKGAPAEGAINLEDVDLSTLALFIGITMFFFAVIVGGDRLISLTDDQKRLLISQGSRLMLTSEDVTRLDDITQLLYH